MVGWVNAFEEAGLLRELVGVWIASTRRWLLPRDAGRHQSLLGRLSMMSSGYSMISPRGIADMLGR
ncbi:MAG: hypothetical protein LM600_03760 [Thaumarchaeota archaeon]|nr:hypothetical protein [Nitrososphaerota archaeon]